MRCLVRQKSWVMGTELVLIDAIISPVRLAICLFLTVANNTLKEYKKSQYILSYCPLYSTPSPALAPVQLNQPSCCIKPCHYVISIETTKPRTSSGLIQGT